MPAGATHTATVAITATTLLARVSMAVSLSAPLVAYRSILLTKVLLVDLLVIVIAIASQMQSPGMYPM